MELHRQCTWTKRNTRDSIVVWNVTITSYDKFRANTAIYVPQICAARHILLPINIIYYPYFMKIPIF